MTARDELHQLAEEHWDAALRSAPLWATVTGDHRFDDRIEDPTAAGDAARRGEVASLLDRARALEQAPLDRDDAVTLGLLVDALETELIDLDSGMAVLRVDPLVSHHANQLTLAPQLQFPDAESAGRVLERFRHFGTLFDGALGRYLEGLERGWTPPGAPLRRSINIVEKYLASSPGDDLFANVDGPDDPAWRVELRQVVDEQVRPAFARFAEGLRDQLLPHARTDERSGLCWLEGGDELYRAQIRVHTGLDADPEEVHQIGLDELARLDDEYARVGPAALGTAEVSEIFARVRTDPELRYHDAAEMRAHAERCIEQAAAAMPGWFGRLPKAPCVVTPVPEALAADSPAAYYVEPTEDGSRPGTYFLNTLDPAGTPRVEMAAVAFHEAIPGHHLQLAISVEQEGVPTFQRHAGSTAFVEGWALYAERLADEMGLYADPVDLLGMLAGDSWRAARLVVDTGMHALGWTRAQAVDFMRERTPAPLADVETEIDRYIGWPGQALAYKLGQLELFRLRSAAEATLGGRFDLPAFHDAVLTSGSLSLPVLQRKIDWYVDDRR